MEYFAEAKNLIVTEAKWRWGLSYGKKEWILVCSVLIAELFSIL